MKEFDDIMNRLNLFWQYPVITEKIVYQQQYNNANYFGIPWAILIDKHVKTNYNLNIIINILESIIPKRNYITSCQHVLFYKLFTHFKQLNIKTVYSPHKKKGENYINGIRILPCPLYAVNFEDPARNKEFMNIDYEKCPRDLLYSFIGGYVEETYLTNVRERIFNMKHPENTIIKNTGSWHFYKDVYLGYQSKKGKLIENDEDHLKTKIYNEVLLRSEFSLCPSGSGPNSIRLWESLACGSIPVLLSDTLELPRHKLWDDAILKIREKNVETIPEILNSISENQKINMRKNCLIIYNDFKNNFLML